jgi:hypothetical protein
MTFNIQGTKNYNVLNNLTYVYPPFIKYFVNLIRFLKPISRVRLKLSINLESEVSNIVSRNS